jgi:hypothetical protein
LNQVSVPASVFHGEEVAGGVLRLKGMLDRGKMLHPVTKLDFVMGFEILQ